MSGPMRQVLAAALILGLTGIPVPATAEQGGGPGETPGTNRTRADASPASAAAGADLGPGPTVLELHLEEAVARARDASPRLAELRALLAAARSRVDGAEAERMPSLDLSAGYTRLSDVPELSVPVGGELRTIFRNIPNDIVFGASVVLPLFTGGRVDAGVVGAERDVEARLAEIAASSDAVVLEATVAWWQLTVTEDRERVLGEAIASFEAHLEDARNRLRVGLAAPDEPLAVEVELERARLDRLRAESRRRVAEDALAALLDLPADARIDPVVTEVQASPPPPEDVAELVEEALGERPERRALQARIAAAEAGTRAARAAGRPQVSLSASLEYANPNRRILPPEDDFDTSWQVGIGVTFNAFDGGRRDARVAESMARATGVRERLHALDRDIRTQVVSAWEELRTAVAAVAVAERGVDSARESLRVAVDRHREGVAPSSRRLDAETALLRAQLRLADAHAAVALARARLDRAVGR